MKQHIARAVPIRPLVCEFPSFRGWVGKFLPRLLGWGSVAIAFTLFAMVLAVSRPDTMTFGQTLTLAGICGVALVFIGRWIVILNDVVVDHRERFVPGHRAWLKRQIEERATLLRQRYKFNLDASRSDTKFLRLTLDNCQSGTPAHRLVDDVLHYRRRLERLSTAA